MKSQVIVPVLLISTTLLGSSSDSLADTAPPSAPSVQKLPAPPPPPVALKQQACGISWSTSNPALTEPPKCTGVKLVSSSNGSAWTTTLTVTFDNPRGVAAQAPTAIAASAQFTFAGLPALGAGPVSGSGYDATLTRGSKKWAGHRTPAGAGDQAPSIMLYEVKLVASGQDHREFAVSRATIAYTVVPVAGTGAGTGPSDGATISLAAHTVE